MKPLQGDSVNSNSCSCNSCDSKSESDRETLKRLIVQGSKINKLLTGKYYIHLRDSNLLETLIKTRALYDALRSQLLSSTESSTADLKPRQSSIEIKKAFVEAKKSSDIFKLVDLAEKGAVTGLKKLSECCSCCTCSSKFRFYENVQKGRRNRQVHAGGNIASRSSLASKQETGDAKNIKSDPCTCACYKNENIKKSREITEKIRPQQQIIERDRLSTASNNHKKMFHNNGKLRNSYHKLKRAKACPSPYMENIGEGGNKIIRKPKQEIALKKKKSIEMLKLAQKTVLDCFKTDRQTLKKKEPAGSMVGKTAEECMIHVKKTVTTSNDQVGKRLAPSPELKKSFSHRSRKQNQARKENTNESIGKISDISSTSNTITHKEAPFTTGNKRQPNYSKAKKLNKKLLQQAASVAESNTEIFKNAKESYPFGGSNQVQKTKENKIPPQKNPTEVANKIRKQLPISSTAGKDPIKSNTDTIPGIQKSVSIGSIKKSDPARFNKTSSNSLNKINKPKLKSRSSVSLRKRLRLLSAPLRFRPHPQIKEEPSLHKEPVSARHKKPSGLRQRNLKSGSHALKRCFCTVKLKINETKSKSSKNVSNENLNVKDNQSMNSKNLLSAVKTLIKASNLNLHDPKYMPGKATKCEYSDYVNQNQAMKRNKRPTQKESNADLEIKYNVINDKLSIHASISDCICNELEELMYRRNQPHIEFGDSNHHVSNDTKEKMKIRGENANKNNSYNINLSIHASECELFNANFGKKEKRRCKEQRGKSNTLLRTKSTLKDASITTEKPRKLQNQAVQTVINSTSKQKQEIEISMKQLEKKKPNTCNPRFSIELFNKGFSNNGIKITQSKVKFVYKCDGTKQLPNKHSQTSSSTQRPKFMSPKHGLRRCFCKLQLGKQENKKYNQRKVSQVTLIQPTNKIKGSRDKLKIVTHDKLLHKYDFSICSPKRCSPQQLKVGLVKREERNLKKRIKTKSRSNFSLTSRSMQLPRTKKIHSTLTSPNSEILTPILKRNKTKPSDIATYRVRSIFSRKIFKSKRFCSPIDKDNEMNKDTKIRSSKNLLLRNKKLEQNSLFGLTRKQCLCTVKSRKKGKYYKNSSLVKTDTKSNIIAVKINPKFQKGTKLIESKYSDQLKPYESKCLEPFVLENNKNKTFKHFGFVTDKTNMKSKSSDTRALRSTSKLLFVKSDLQQRNTSLQNFKKMRKYSDLSHLPQRVREMYFDNFMKQSVKMGSNFSFNIELYKGITPVNNFNRNRSKKINVQFLHNKEEYSLLTKRYSSHRNTRLHTKRVSSTPNRCLCTLKISKMDEQSRNSKLLSPFGTKQLTQVYAVSTVAIGKNKIKTPEILEVDHDYPCIDSYYPTYSKNTSSHTKQWQYFNKSPTSGLSISMIAFKTKNVQSYHRERKYKLLQISSRDQSLLDFASNESVRFETEFSCEIDYLKNICSKKRQILRTAQSRNYTLELRQRTPENPETKRAQNITHQYISQLTGVQPLLRRCYCTMNIQVARQKRKLLDYECEPGICIPDDCDPYECQKLIMKRLMRQVSRISGTESRSSSSFCETTSTGSCAKKLQSDFGEPKHRTRGHDPRSRSRPRPRPVRPQGLKYQTLPRTAQAPAPAPAHRQAVRVGSAFSFDIEFSKGSSKSAPTTDFVKVPKRRTSSRSSTTYPRHGMNRSTKYGDRRHHRETQSMMKQMRHRASSVTPMLKRCFCTLKLQKKGRQQKERELRGTDHGTSTPPKFSVEKPILRTTERGQNTKRKRRSPELLPYECEPGICVPGGCDPYECLELIKRRNKHTKDFGTDSMPSTTSSSSMTSSQKRKRKRIQSRNIRAKKVRSRDTSVRSKPSVMSIDRPAQDRPAQDRPVKDRQVQDRPSKPSRQAVKISSTFSFNIEFYKDKAGSCNDSDTQPSEVFVQKSPKKVRIVPKEVYAHRRMRESSSQHRKRTRDDDSQIGIYQRGRSTMTSSFLKRCFCTAKLQGINVDAATGARQHRSLAKLKRCFCTLKLMSASKRRRRVGNVGYERATPISDKRVGMTQTRGRSPPVECDPACEAAVKTQTRERFPALLPYECEPGVCEPGFCDPHECIKLKRKRLGKEKMTGTTGPRTTSTSSNFSSSQPSRAIMTQSRLAWPKAKMTQARSARRRERGRRRDYSPRETVLQEPVLSPVSPQRQAVRIGSNFSFNIEFYKDKGSSNLDVQAAAPLVKRSRPIRMRDRGHGAYRRMRTRDRGLRGRRFPALSRDSQMDPTKSRDIGLGPILRRCFCTLKLQKQAKIKSKTKALTKAASKAETKAASKAASKASSKAASKAASKAGSKAASKAASKAEAKVDTKAETGAGTGAETKKVPKETDGQKNKKSKQKNKCLCTPPVKEVATLHTKSVMTAKKTKEIVSVKKPKESIVSRKTPKESIEKVKKPKESIVILKMPKRRKAFPYKLEPYECEPGICVPGECDPYECLKLINKRLMYSSGTSTDRRGTRSTSNMTDYGRGHRHSETQSFMQRKKPMRTRDTRTRDREIPPHRERRPHTERRSESRSTEYRSTVVEKATKQAVKLGSSFNFDIEFFKDKSHGGPVVASRPIKRDVAYDKPRRTSSRSTEWRSTYSRNKKAQLSRANRDMDSQALSPSMRSTMTGTVAPFLKRCFCTLQLHCKTENQGTPFDCLSDVSKREKVKSQTKRQTSSAERKSYSRKQAQSPGRKLLPYECEPGVCVPGECDPYECIKRIKRRMQSKQAGTESYKCQSISSSTDGEITYIPGRIQARSYPSRRNVKTSQCDVQCQDVTGSRSISSSSDERRKHRPRIKARSYSPSWRYEKTSRRNDMTSRRNDKTSWRSSKISRDHFQFGTSPKRQAVRIGSNFSFNIEFFKDKSPQVPSVREVNQIVKKEEKNKVNGRSAKRETVPRPNKRGTTARPKTTKNMSYCGRKDCSRDVRSQSQFKRTDTKGIGTPLLKRCFCTLKLEKKGKQRFIIPKNIEPSFKCVSTHTKSKSKTKAEIEPVAREIGTKTKNKNCKCNTQKDNSPKAKKCKCNTKKNTKNKNCKCNESCECETQQKAEPDEFPCKEGKECKCCKCNTYALQSYEYRCKKGKDCKCSKCKCNTYSVKSIKESNKYRCKKGKKCTCSQCNAPAFETNQELNEYRYKTGKDCKCSKCSTPTLEPNEFPCKKGKECKCCKCNAVDIPLKQDQNIIPVKKDKCECNKQKKTKCNGQDCVCDNGPKEKKCKCNTVKTCVYKKNTKKKNCKCNESCACETVQTSDKKTSTKGKYDPLQKFEPVECGKDVCEPGEYSPYGSLKKGTRRMSGTLDVRSERTSRVSSMAAQFIPGYTHKRIKYKGEPYSPENIDSIVEEPRYPFLHGKDARQGVKICSNFSFNIEFFKEMLPPVVDNVKKVDKKNSPRLKKENGRDIKIGHYGDKKDPHSTELQSRSDRPETTSSPVAMLRKCFCSSKLQKSIHRQSLAVCRVEEIRPMSCFQPRDYWVQYQTQQTTKYFITNPQELETIMSYAPSRYDKINNKKDCRSCRKTNFNLVDPTKNGSHVKGIPKQSETKQSTLKKMFYYCKNIFTKLSNKQNIMNTERCMELKTKATNKHPLIDIKKPSKSERHPNKAAIADKKKSKSFKAAKVNGKDDYKNKYSRFQSGDHQGTKSQNIGIKFKKKCQDCQIKLKHAIPLQDNVRFTTLRTNKALKCKPNARVTEQEKDTKPVSFLFKSLKFKTSEDIKNLKLCSCCGGIKIIRNLPSASNLLNLKNKLSEYSEDAITTVISKDLIAIPTKMDISEEETELTQENQKKNKQSCPCCVCKSVFKPNTKQGKKDSLGVSGSSVYKREIGRRAGNTHHVECIGCKKQCGTPICPAESEKEALASETGCCRDLNQKKKKENFEQKAKTHGNVRKVEDKNIAIENKTKEKSKKLTKYKNTPDSLLVTESVLAISKLELKRTGDILSNLHRAVSDPKGTYRKCQSYLRDSMRAWNKIQKPANNDPGVETLKFLKLRCQARKCVKAGEEILEDYPLSNFGKHSNNADRRKGFHPKKSSWRRQRHPGCGFGWSPFMISLRKKPWLSAYYKCAGSYPRCLTILQVWRQFMDIILFLLAVAVSSPCLLGIELCRSLKFCFLCTD